MNIVNRLFGLLARIHSVVYLLLGMALMQLLIHEIGFSSIVKELKNSLWVIAPSWLSVNWACAKFYGEKYEIIYPKKWANLMAAIPEPDTFFYQTMVSDIENARRLAGYLYVFDKVLMFCVSGGALALLFNKI